MLDKTPWESSAWSDVSEQAHFVNVTPEIAQKILDASNHGNRKIRPSVVNKYARMMSAGDWRFSPETISFSKSGRMLNGQHRFLAIIKSGITCRFLFATGFDEDVFQVLDRGAKRSRADALNIDSKSAEVGSLLATIAGSIHGETSPSDFDVKRARDCISEVHDELIEFCGTTAKIFSSAAFRLACVARVMGGADHGRAFSLYRDLVLKHTQSLPPVGHAAIRMFMSGRLITGGGRHQTRYNLCVAWDIFNPNSANKSRIVGQVKIEEIRKIVEVTGYAAP